MRFYAPVLLAFLLVLSGCGGEAPKNYSYTLPPTPGGRLCTNQCVDAQNFCHQTCDLDNRKCVSKVQTQALQDYDKYTREQFSSHLAIDLRPRDFERMASCDSQKKSCSDECESHYQVCYQTCGGKVDTSTSCLFLCF